MQMGYNLFYQWLSDTLAALLIVLILTRSTSSAIRGLYTGLAFGVFACRGGDGVVVGQGKSKSVSVRFSVKGCIKISM